MHRALFLLLLLLFLLPSPVAGQGPEERTMWEMINAARAENGVGLLAWNDLLAEAAQRHAEDIVRRNDPSHTGSDGSSPAERAARVGYPAYPDGVRASENWSTGTLFEAMTYFIEDEPHRVNMLLPLWREVGIGHAEVEGGWELWVVLHGAQPGVLPIFVNGDEERTTEPRVIVQLRAEEAGYSEAIFTAPVEMRVAEEEEIEAAPWQPWAPEIEIALRPPGGEQVVVAELRDPQGRVVRSEDRIFLVATEGPLPTARAQLAPTLTPTATPTVTPTPTATATPTATPVPTATPTPEPLLPALPADLNWPLLVLGLFVVIIGLVFLIGLLIGRAMARR